MTLSIKFGFNCIEPWYLADVKYPYLFSGNSVSLSAKSDISEVLAKSKFPSCNYNLEADMNAI